MNVRRWLSGNLWRSKGRMGMWLLLFLSLLVGGTSAVAAKDRLAPMQQISVAGYPVGGLGDVRNPSVAVDGQGGVHLAMEPVSPPIGEDGLPVQYGYCAAHCMEDENWQVIRVGEAGLEGSEVRIRLNSAGKPRLVWFFQSDWRQDGVYLYASCDNNCTQPANWQTLPLALDSVGPSEGRYFALDRQGNPHLLYSTSSSEHQGTFYLYCLGSCLSASSWREVKLSDNYLWGAFSLAFDSQNRIHLAVSIEQENETLLWYLFCATSCEATSNWQAAPLAPLGVGLEFGLQLDGLDRPRIAVFTGALDDEQVADKLYYLWCDSQCLMGKQWNILNMGLAAGEGGHMDFVLDRQGRPHFVVASSLYLPDEFNYLYCSSQCDSNPVWQRHRIEEGGGTSCYWYVGKRPAMAWNGGELLVAYGDEGRCMGQDKSRESVGLVGLQGVDGGSSAALPQAPAQPAGTSSPVATPTPLPPVPGSSDPATTEPVAPDPVATDPTETVDANAPLALLGLTLSDQAVVDFILGNNCVLVGMHYMCRSVGVELSLTTSQKVVTVFLFAEGAEGYKKFKGKLPFGLSWAHTRAQIEANLGAPTASGGGGSMNYWVSYQPRKLGITYKTLSTTDMDATMHNLQVRLK
jgi:hypothetical protein